MTMLEKKNSHLADHYVYILWPMQVTHMEEKVVLTIHYACSVNQGATLTERVKGQK